ncbi:MAG TPA: NapC/NirT family cytochrome c [Terriglobales bacterium]|nr:NapC/NirT family cytochrome c [Terriglobales bacterium]
MSLATALVVALIAVALVLALLVTMRAELTRAPAGKVLAFVALFLLPTLAVWSGFNQQMQLAESTQFCLSCHVMSDYGHSLYVDDPSYIPAVHFQNRFVPRDHACYTCHTDYTLFGTVHSKLRGLHHLEVEYLGTIPAPDKIRLYVPFNNRECLHCHLGARTFEEERAHHRTPTEMADIKADRLSCMTSKCHDTVHAVDTLHDASFWKPEN